MILPICWCEKCERCIMISYINWIGIKPIYSLLLSYNIGFSVYFCTRFWVASIPCRLFQVSEIALLVLRQSEDVCAKLRILMELTFSFVGEIRDMAMSVRTFRGCHNNKILWHTRQLSLACLFKKRFVPARLFYEDVARSFLAVADFIAITIKYYKIFVVDANVYSSI